MTRTTLFQEFLLKEIIVYVWAKNALAHKGIANNKAIYNTMMGQIHKKGLSKCGHPAIYEIDNWCAECRVIELMRLNYAQVAKSGYCI